jgi:nicotinate phosphoribosyltransferase
MKMFPHAMGTFTFVDRNKEVYTQEFLEALKLEIYSMSDRVYLCNEAFDWAVQNIPFVPRHYWEWLRGFRYNPDELNLYLDKEGHLHIEATGPLYRITLWEVPLLAMVSELTLKNTKVVQKKDVIEALKEKVVLSNLNALPFSEFGTRRRFSSNVQDWVCEYLSEYSTYCTGTSNCHFAMKYGMKPMGTHPHEWFMFHGAQFGYKNANYMALENWVKVYDGDLGIALSDTYTSKVFLQNFSLKQAKLFDGVRQDSGDPFKFATSVIDRYTQLRIDPMTKTIVFSDALTFPKALEIQNYCKGRIRCSFGIGTNLTNDVGVKPLNIVMKLTSCQMTKNTPVYNCVKLSDDEGKHIGKDVGLCKMDLGL